MATKNIVPRANNEGSIGTASKQWSKVYAVGNSAGMVFDACTSALSSFTLTAGAVLSSPTAGAFEKDSNVFYSTPIASARGVSPSTMFAIIEAGDFALATTSGVQSAFPTTKDVWTLAASTTYLMEGQYFITHSTTTATCAMAFAAGGGASATAIGYSVYSCIVAANGAPAAVLATYVDQIATTVVTATSTVGWVIKFRGLLRTNAAGTWTPQVNFSANTTVPVMKTGSYITFTPLGTNTTNSCGNVA